MFDSNTGSLSGSSLTTHRDATSTSNLSSNTTQASNYNYPPIPKISGDLILETFTHRSLYPDANNNNNNNNNNNFNVDDSAMGMGMGPGDNRRLSIVGDLVLKLIVTNLLYWKRMPWLGAGEIVTETEKILSNENLERWIVYYRLRDKLRFSPDVQSQLGSAEETRTLFTAYVGAVYLESGLSIVSDWIAKLINSSNLKGLSESTPLGFGSVGAGVDNDSNMNMNLNLIRGLGGEEERRRPSKKVKSEPPGLAMSLGGAQQDGHSPGGLFHPPLFASPSPLPLVGSTIGSTQLTQGRAKTFSPAPAPAPALALAPTNPTPNTNTNTNTNTNQTMNTNASTNTSTSTSSIFLPSFNQRCAQNKLQVEYQAEFRGPPHAGQWEITCIVNGVVKGHGYGNSKQIAKEEAAKQAFYGMGWNNSD